MSKNEKMKISDDGVKFIIAREIAGDKSKYLKAYPDPIKGKPWTIGVGHTKGVYEGQKITLKELEQFLREDLKDCENAIRKLVTVSLNQNQFDALCAFFFNCGSGEAVKNSTLLKKINAGDFKGAADEFPKWNKCGIVKADKTIEYVVVDGLTKRRNLERDLFQKAPDFVPSFSYSNWRPSSSSYGSSSLPLPYGSSSLPPSHRSSRVSPLFPYLWPDPTVTLDQLLELRSSGVPLRESSSSVGYSSPSPSYSSWAGSSSPSPSYYSSTRDWSPPRRSRGGPSFSLTGGPDPNRFGVGVQVSIPIPCVIM